MNADIKETAAWLNGLAEKGGKGVVGNIDARSLGRVAVALEAQARVIEGLRKALAKIVFDWDGEPEDMVDAVAALALVEPVKGIERRPEPPAAKEGEKLCPCGTHPAQYCASWPRCVAL
jgi:hypothetical protein